jgi:hypothetical protein
VIKANGFGGQRQAYIGAVKAHYRKAYSDTKWSVVR